MIVILSEYYSYHVVYLTDDRITRQSTARTSNVVILDPRQMNVMFSEYHSSVSQSTTELPDFDIYTM